MISICEISNIIGNTICEAMIQDKKFQSWESFFLRQVNEMKVELERDYLTSLGLRIQFLDNKTFKGESRNWLALYGRTQNVLGKGIIAIALNLPYFYKCMCEMGIEDDEYEIEAQAKITVGHEVGHALIDYFVDYYEGEAPAVKQFVTDFWNGDIDEEEEAEAFGESMAAAFTGVYDCRILDILDIISNKQ